MDAAAEPTASLQGVRTLFSDSLPGIELALQRGLPGDARILTLSPAVVVSGRAGVVQADLHLEGTGFRRLGDICRESALRMHGAVQAVAGLEPLALCAARSFIWHQNLIHKAMCLEEAHFVEPVAVAFAQFAKPALTNKFTPPWRRLLADNPGLVALPVPVDAEQERQFATETPPSLGRRLRFEDVSSIGYRLGQRLFDRLPGWRGRGVVLVRKETPLLKETCFSLMLRGFVPRLLPQPRTDLQPESVPESFDAVVTPILLETLEQLCAPGVAGRVLPLFLDAFRRDAAAHLAALKGWEEVFQRPALSGAKLAMIGNTSRLEDVALHQVARRHGLPLASTQHAISREMNANLTVMESHVEASACDVYFTYNEVSATHTDAIRYPHASVHAVGLTRDLIGVAAKTRPDPAAPPIMYATTILYGTNFQPPAVGGVSDVWRARVEVELLREVFGRLPHRVRYKPRSERRLSDADPVLDTARALPNMEIRGDDIDLRYMVGDCRVLVTSRATGTLAWCVMCDRPLVFIDMGADTPLLPEAKAAISEALFYFDLDQPEGLAQLRDFLSQPIEDIERQWQTRRAARERYLERFLGRRDGKAGSRAADILMQRLGK